MDRASRRALLAGNELAQAWLSVQDGCGGIADDDLPRVVDVGFRGTAARTPESGSGAGLGLSIARALVEAHGGRIGVANAGAGCRVRLTLPLGERTASPSVSAAG